MIKLRNGGARKCCKRGKKSDLVLPSVSIMGFSEDNSNEILYPKQAKLKVMLKEVALTDLRQIETIRRK